jgi:hypothetical protein
VVSKCRHVPALSRLLLPVLAYVFQHFVLSFCLTISMTRKKCLSQKHTQVVFEYRWWLVVQCADHSSRAVARTVFARSNAGIVGSNLTQGMDVCVRLFCVCVVVCVGSGLATRLITRPRSPTVCIKKITELKKRPGPLMNERFVTPGTPPTGGECRLDKMLGLR